MNHAINDRQAVSLPPSQQPTHAPDAQEQLGSQKGSPQPDTGATTQTIDRLQTLAVRQIKSSAAAANPEFEEQLSRPADGRCTTTPPPAPNGTTLTAQQHQNIGEELAKGRLGSAKFGIDKETILTPRDQNMILFHAGELGNEQIARDIWRDGYNADFDAVPAMVAGRFFIRARAAIARYCDESRAAAAIASVGDATTALFSKRDDERQRRLIVHPSTYEPGKWQLTAVDERGPWGHTIHATKQQAIRSAIGAMPLADGGPDYELTWHNKCRKPAPF